MRTRAIVIVLMAAMAVYLVLMGQRAVWLISEGSLVSVLLGLGVLALPVIGVTVIVSEWRFGTAAERLGRQLAAEGWTPQDDPALAALPRRPSGRVDRAAAEQAFAVFAARVEQAPRDWRAWYQLAVAYDMAGDRPRGRRAMRQAISLGREQSEEGGPGDASGNAAGNAS